MLEWLTFAAAAIAAVGAVLSPFITSRTSSARRQQDDVDRYVEFAISADATIRGLGLSHLGFLLKSDKLTPAQANAASAAVNAAFRKAEELVGDHPDAAVAELVGPAAGRDVLVAEWDSGDETEA